MVDSIKPKGAALLRLELVIQTNRGIADACERLAAVLAARPELDKDVCRAFGIPLPIEKK
jgi:hypothetical protein